MKSDTVEKLRLWFLKNRRCLPWRDTNNSYYVWVSEVMLQQTQVDVVFPYFERFIKKFPTLFDLAKAPVEEVIKLWEGLGYYSRARHLHVGAKMIVEQFSGVLPPHKETLLKIKGIGPYTAAAILSFAFKMKAAAVDGNVLRVLARFFGIKQSIDDSRTIAMIEKKVIEFLPKERPYEVSEGLIELGALVCKKQAPNCFSCPLRSECVAFKRQITVQLPIRKKRPKTTLIKRLVLILECEECVLVQRNTQKKIMQDLYEFPYLEITKKPTKKDALQYLSSLNIEAEFLGNHPMVQHSFTRFVAHLFPFSFRVREKKQIGHCDWIEKNQCHKKPFSSGHKKILQKNACN
jgi:A/G-specific adenine glycosylase